MRKIMVLLPTLFIITFSAEVHAKRCTGKFVNPITDICWACILPITIGSIPVVPGFATDTINYPDPVCGCPAPPPIFVRPGIAIGYWEPAKMVDVTKAPFCFVGIGGIEIDPGIDVGSGGDPEKASRTDYNPATWHVHWYDYPVFALLEFALDSLCLDPIKNAVDINYISEVDPLWLDDELSFIINPESILFGNLIAQAACAADCLAASTYLPIDPLFWCSGCQGGMYPSNGKVATHVTSIQSSLLATSRLILKMHRQTLLPITSGPEAICSSIPSPMIKKSQYRMQLTTPVATINPYQGCNPLGKTSFMWEGLKEIPTEGEDFNYLIWRKRNCCAI